ncbi:hypothetical protein ACM66Z_05805 [Sulfurovum sp. ST-21]|uniref:ABC transporter Uup C-terminal domain-containing protein n=1 Tax=Sulfurovum indicum TaxID=2779528 RepID=A0A7M1S148_9BACT|nr:hypothetical protein [Sulfurovum indicum]QOR60974.1 hypothetical protein IMZ28_05765 [Sulfurovum indicum]
MNLTEEQLAKIAKKDEYEALKKRLVQKRKEMLEDIEFAENDFDEYLIEQEREKLAKEIKTLAANLREIEEWEALA